MSYMTAWRYAVALAVVAGFAGCGGASSDNRPAGERLSADAPQLCSSICRNPCTQGVFKPCMCGDGTFDCSCSILELCLNTCMNQVQHWQQSEPQCAGPILSAFECLGPAQCPAAGGLRPSILRPTPRRFAA